MPEAPSPIPQKRPEDPEEVAQELTLADTSWKSGNQTEALAALRRAASVAYRLHAGRRVSELAKAVAELSKTMMGGTPSAPNQKVPGPSAAARAAAPSAPKAPVAAAAPPADADDIPISLEDVEDVEVVDDPFPSSSALASHTTKIATPAPMKVAAAAAAAAAANAKKEGAAERPTRASSRPGKGRRSTPPKAKDGGEKSGSLVVASPAASETSGVLDTKVNEPPKSTAKEPSLNGENPALQHRPTPVGEDAVPSAPKIRPALSAPPPTQNFAESEPSQRVAKNVVAPAPAPNVIEQPSIADLANVVTLASFDEAARAKLIAAAKPITLAKGEKCPAPAVLIVVRGEVDIRPKERSMAVDRVPAGEARNLEAAPPCQSGELVLVAGEGGARCLGLPRGALDPLAQLAPDVHAALQRRADELCAFAAVMRERPVGGLADSLLLELRRRAEVRRLEEGTIIVRLSEPVRALVVVTSGALTLHADENGPEIGRIRPGEVLFPRELVGKSASPREARVAAGGAVVLAARRAPTVTLLDEHVHLRKALETWGADDPFQEW